MTFLEAARLVLEESKTSLHFEEITRRAQMKGLLTTSGATPDATMGSRLYTASKQENPEFVREGKGKFGLARRRPKGIDQQIEAINQRTRAQLKQKLQTMHPREFEALILDLLFEMGFDESTLEVTPYGGDGGIDVVGVYRAAGLTQVNAAVQAKRWKNNVQAPQVTGLRGSLTVHQQGIIITTSGFSEGAKREAEALGKTRVGLIDGDELIELLIKYRIGVIDKTHTIIQLDEERWGAIQDIDQPQSVSPPRIVMPQATRTNRTKAEPESSRPTYVCVLGKSYPIRTWKEGLLKVADTLYRMDPKRFEENVFGLHGKKRIYVAATPDAMHTPAKVDNLSIFVETNQNSQSMRACASLMMKAAGYSSGDVVWTMDGATV